MTDERTSDGDGEADRGGEERRSSFFGEVARALGETAGRTKERLRSLTERGAIHLAVKKIEKEKAEKLQELGELARKALVSGRGSLGVRDPGAADLLGAIDRLEQKIDRLEKEAEGLRAEAADEDEGCGGESAKE